VLDAALAYLDEHGLPALSMRKLGARLGVEAMTLYHYVPNKDALLDGLVDRVMEVALGGLGEPAPGDWTPWMRQFAHSLRAAGLSLGRAMDVVNVVATFTIGHTLAEAGRTPGHEGSEPDLDQRADELDPAEFPNLTEIIATRAGLDFTHRFTQAIDILLAGYATLEEPSG
jgi:AcrR family transcriptional regulator